MKTYYCKTFNSPIFNRNLILFEILSLKYTFFLFKAEAVAKKPKQVPYNGDTGQKLLVLMLPDKSDVQCSTPMPIYYHPSLFKIHRISKGKFY